MTPTDPALGEKRKKRENFVKVCKKRKGDKSVGIVVLTNDDYTLLMDAMEKVSNQSLKKIYERQIKITISIIDLLQMLCKEIK